MSEQAPVNSIVPASPLKWVRDVGCSTGSQDVGASEMMCFDIFKKTHSRKRFLQTLVAGSMLSGGVDQYNYFKQIAPDVDFQQQLLDAKNERMQCIRTLTVADISNTQREGLQRIVLSFEKHYRTVVQVVFREPYHHWDEVHVKELLQPLIRFDRDVSRIIFCNRGGRFIVIHCPVLLQGLKAAQCVVSNIKRGGSYLFRDAAVVVDYFPSPSQRGGLEPERYTRDSGAQPDAPQRSHYAKLSRMKERRRKLALKLLQEKQVLPIGSNPIDQRVIILQRLDGLGRGVVDGPPPEERSAKMELSSERAGKLPALNLSLLGRVTPMTRRHEFDRGDSLSADVCPPMAQQDPQIEATADSFPQGFIFGVNADSVTDFRAVGASGATCVSMRIPLARVMESVPLDESPRDYDLLNEGVGIRHRRGRPVYSSSNPPDSALRHAYWFDDTGNCHRKCALHEPFMYFVDGDSRFQEILREV